MKKIALILVCLFLMHSLAYAQEGLEMNKKLVMIIASEGFRDEELLEPKKVFQNNGIKVEVASNNPGEATGMLGARITPDMTVNDIDIRDFDAIVFVGGTGAAQYWQDPVALQLAQDAYRADLIVAAICIAPVTLANAGILKGKRATVYPSEAGQLQSAGANYTSRPVERDGNIITADGPASAREFAEEIVKALNR